MSGREPHRPDLAVALYAIIALILAALTVVVTWSVTRRWGPSAPK